MIEPLLRDDAFLADVRAAAADAALHVWWLGQSGFLVRSAGRFLLFDPYLSDSLTAKYAGTDKPHVRMTARVIAPERLDFIDVVTSSHNHTDHLDAETLRPLFAVNPALRLVLPEANRAFAIERLAAGEVGQAPRLPESGAGAPPAQPAPTGQAGRLPDISQAGRLRHFAEARLIGLDDGTRASVAGFEFTGVPAAHNDLERDAAGRCKFMGFVVRCGAFTIYHSGDTLRYDGMEERLRALGPIDLALLPINGHRPERRVAGNLDGPEAARLARAIGARCVVPCHCEMFEFNTASPAAFAAECTRLGQPCQVLRAGEGIALACDSAR